MLHFRHISNLFLIFVVTAAFSADKVPIATWEGKVMYVLKGDTIQINFEVNGRESLKEIRLYGIESPERNQASELESKGFTSGMCYNMNVKVLVYDMDKEGRRFAVILLPDGKNLNEEIVRAGFAWHDKEHSKDEVLAALEKEAKNAGRGFWKDATLISPWERRQRKNQEEKGETKIVENSLTDAQKAWKQVIAEYSTTATLQCTPLRNPLKLSTKQDTTFSQSDLPPSMRFGSSFAGSDSQTPEIQSNSSGAKRRHHNDKPDVRIVSQKCTKCNGTGRCQACRGTGRDGYSGGKITRGEACYHCDGSGVCSVCHGTGEEKIKYAIIDK